MANRRQPYQWQHVKPGDIISFRYVSAEKGSRLQTILVLNPRYTMELKNGKILVNE